MVRTDEDGRGEQPGGPGATAAAPPRGSRTRSRIATAVGVFGELLITVGVLLALFVVYSLWWTNVIADREAKKQSDKVRENWAKGPGALDTRDGIGFLHAPGLKEGEILVKKGTATQTLNNGVAGYYTKPVKSAMPWDKKGNFTLAAHRDGHGAKFHNIDKLDEGDAVVFETRDVWYVYRVYAKLPETSKYNVDVLAPIPKESGKKKPGRYLTLSTCTPVYTSRHRYIVWAELERTEKVDANRTEPAELR
ncbi:class E sortase [Streptomyces buecherae]|uniref:class E sortase n=1 Tax=Streptomyces buecherae TaxID=2763006 RepID=UPI003654356D